MNEVIKAIKDRRSIRRYKPDMVPKELIDEVIEAGLYAATAAGKQPCKVIAITNKEARDRLSEVNRNCFPTPVDMDPFYGAPVVLVVLADKNFPPRVYDGSLVLGNMMLAAYSLGLGSCWIHRAKEEFETEEYKQFLKDLGIEGEYEGIGHCILGYPEGEHPKAAPRKPDMVYYIE